VTIRNTGDVNCTSTCTITITEPEVVACTTTKTDATCNGAADGTATVTPTGGTSAYTYAWSDSFGQTGATATGLLAGTYTVTVTDANACTRI